MSHAVALPLVAVDIGNTRVKLGVFGDPVEEQLPQPQTTLSLRSDWSEEEIEALLPAAPSCYTWVLASVHRGGSLRLIRWLRERGVQHIVKLQHSDLPLVVELEDPRRVGMDRLVNAVAANRLRSPACGAVVMDMGTALTIDLVSARGCFVGGAILPGIAMSARALHEFTDLLPLVTVSEPPPVVGRNTIEAMQSGLYWGAIGAAREVVAQMLATAGPCEIFLTGGAGPLLVDVLASEVVTPRFVPHLTLAGIAIAALANSEAR